MHISRITNGRPPAGTAATAIGMHRAMIAWEPLIIVPTKKIMANFAHLKRMD